MSSWFSRTVLLFSLAAAGCAAPVESSKPDASVADHVLASVPADVQNRTLVDFGGAVHLVGWDLEPKDRAAPDSKLKLKLYWRSVKRLSDGWRLFTHLSATGLKKPYSYDDHGVLRQKLPPSAWVPGMIYVDEQEITVPDLEAPEVTIAVGLHREALQIVGKEVDGLSGLRLSVLSGLSDGQDRAIIARLPTGVSPGQKKAKQERKPRAGDRRPGSGDRPRQLRDPARPSARPEPTPKETP
jgi:hypothetical protein